MAKEIKIFENKFEENVIYTYKHFLEKSRSYFQGNLFDALQDELEALNGYEDDAINHAYQYYESKLDLKIEIFSKIGAGELRKKFVSEKEVLKSEIEKLPKPAKRITEIDATIKKLQEGNVNIVTFVRDNGQKESWAYFKAKYGKENPNITFYEWAEDHLKANSKLGEVQTDFFWVIKNANGEYAKTPNIVDGLPMFVLTKVVTEAQKFSTKDEAENIIPILDDFFKNITFDIVQEELPIMESGGNIEEEEEEDEDDDDENEEDDDYAKGGVLPNQRTDIKFTPYLATGYAEGFEEPPSQDAVIEAWAYLIATKQAYSLQGWFGRSAEELINRGLIERDGTINWEMIDSTHTEMATGGFFNKAKQFGQKGIDATKKGYEATKQYAEEKIHDQKKKIALEVIDDTKDKVKGNRHKITLRGAEELIEGTYSKGGEANGTEINIDLNVIPEKVWETIYELNSRFGDDKVVVRKENDGAYYMQNEGGTASFTFEKNNGLEHIVWKYLDEQFKEKVVGSMEKGGKMRIGFGGYSEYDVPTEDELFAYFEKSGEGPFSTATQLGWDSHHKPTMDYFEFIYDEYKKTKSSGGSMEKGGKAKTPYNVDNIEDYKKWLRENHLVDNDHNQYIWNVVKGNRKSVVSSMQNGGVSIGTKLKSKSTGVEVEVLQYDTRFGGRVLVQRTDEYREGTKPIWRPLRKFVGYSQGGNIDRDIKAKPRGWRFSGKDDYRRPKKSEQGQPGTYYEDRKNRSDKNLRKKL